MPFLELTRTCRESEQPRYEAALEDVGALSVTLLDADVDTPNERAILEPGVGEIPLWQLIRLNPCSIMAATARHCCRPCRPSTTASNWPAPNSARSPTRTGNGCGWTSSSGLRSVAGCGSIPFACQMLGGIWGWQCGQPSNYPLSLSWLTTLWAQRQSTRNPSLSWTFSDLYYGSTTKKYIMLEITHNYRLLPKTMDARIQLGISGNFQENFKADAFIARYRKADSVVKKTIGDYPELIVGAVAYWPFDD